MVKLTYIGPADVRIISVKDFKAAGLTEPTAVKLDVRVDPVAEVNEETSAYLLDKEAGQWKLVPEQEPSLPVES